MPIIDPSPSPDELKTLAALFSRIEEGVRAYLQTAAGANDANADVLTSLAISLNNAADTIAVMQLQLATTQGLQAVAIINQATAELQKALIVRNSITQTLGILQAVVSFGAAIVSDDVGSIISSGSSLYSALTASSSGGSASATTAGGSNPVAAART